MPRLKRVNTRGPGLTRRRQGDGWEYLDVNGAAVTDPATVERIDALVLPPAWQDVWISPVGNGHIQALGTDARGRRQYRYHDLWRVMRDREKHERVLDFAETLPAVRARVEQDLREKQLTRERVLSCAVRLLDMGFFRVGSEQYAEENGTFGLATIRKSHVSVRRDGVVAFAYIAKSGKFRERELYEPDMSATVAALKRRRTDGDEELLAFRDGKRWVDVKSHDINDHIRALTGGEYSAKDFRTWGATVLTAAGLAVSTEAAQSPTARKKAVTRVVKEVAEALGNTPAVCRASYIDPRIIDLYEHGTTVRGALDQLGEDGGFGHPATQGRFDAAVLDLLREPAQAAAA